MVNLEVPMSGDDLYLVLKTAMSIAEEGNNDDDNTKVKLFNGLNIETRTFTFNGIEIDPSSKSMDFFWNRTYKI